MLQTQALYTPCLPIVTTNKSGRKQSPLELAKELYIKASISKANMLRSSSKAKKGLFHKMVACTMNFEQMKAGIKTGHI